MFRLVNVDGRAALADASHWFDLAAAGGDPSLADPSVALARHHELHGIAARLGGLTPSGLLATTVLGPPVPHPQKVFGIGLNYRAHAAETGATLPPVPLTFTKFPTSIAPPVGPLELSGESVDWEVELVVVIGTGGRHLAVADAWSHVAGLTLGQDISDRVVQRAGVPPQFSLGKSFDGYAPIGPAVVSVDAFADPDDIGLWCAVDGEQVQSSRTSDLIFTVPELVAYLSSICTLTPGDLVFTGTPSGVGMARGRFLKPGNELVSGAEHLGELRQQCVAGLPPLALPPR
jgi:2,4-diketo-3-deoxy-L-fuconate hydrolase